MHFTESQKTPHQKLGSNHQRERKRYFEYNHGIAESAVTKAAAQALAAVAQWFVQVFSGCLEGGDESKNKGREDGHAESKEQHRRIQADHGFSRNNVLRHEGDEEFQAAPSQQSSQHGTAQGQDQTLHQELAYQTAAARAQGRANGKFLLAGRGSGQKKISHVSTTDEQQQTYGGEHNIKSGAKAPDDQIRERLNLHRKVLRVILGVDGCQPVRHDSQIRDGLPVRHAGFQMSHKEPVLGESASDGGRGGVARLFWNPQICVAPSEARRHDADQGSRRAV